MINRLLLRWGDSHVTGTGGDFSIMVEEKELIFKKFKKLIFDRKGYIYTHLTVPELQYNVLYYI